jgi:hypothetical protein
LVGKKAEQRTRDWGDRVLNTPPRSDVDVPDAPQARVASPETPPAPTTTNRPPQTTGDTPPQTRTAAPEATTPAPTTTTRPPTTPGGTPPRARTAAPETTTRPPQPEPETPDVTPTRGTTPDTDTTNNNRPRREEATPELTPERLRMRQEGEALSRALPKRQQVPVEVDPDLPGNTVRVHYVVDDKGRISDVHIRAGREATPTDIQLHGNTVRRMQQYSGLSRHVQVMKDRFEGWITRNGTPPLKPA